MIIRPFKPSDLLAIKNIEPHFSESEITQEKATILVAEENNQIVGFIDFWMVENEMSIIEIAVKKDWRRKGIATQLFENIEEGRVIHLEVRASNTPAKKFYEKLGFQVIGVRNKYYADGEDAIVMTHPVCRANGI